jgi:signal transduction histidine kinase
VAGEERYFKPEAIPILDHERQPAGVVLVFHDVTQLRQQDEIKRGVIRTVSHQLKTPLTSVRMAIHLLLEEKVGPLSEKQAELLVAARDDSDRLSGILVNLLDLSRMESGKAAMDFHPTSPSATIREATELFRRAAQDQGLTFEVRVPDDIPEVWADTTRISHIFTNLLSNALKFTPPGGRITLSAEADEGMVRFSIADTGRGIPGQYLPRVFDLFFRIPVESKEGHGAAFTFTLRRADRVAHKENVT